MVRQVVSKEVKELKDKLYQSIINASVVRGDQESQAVSLIEPGDTSSDDFKQSQASDTQHEGGSETIDLQVTAFFAQTIEMNKNAYSKKESKLDISKYVGCIHIDYDLEELSQKDQEQIEQQMKHDASEKLKSANTDSTQDTKLYFKLPVSWFITQKSVRNYIEYISV